MKETTAQKILQRGRDCGADFVEIFEEETRNASVLFKDGKVESAKAGIDFGIGIRLLYGTEVLYGYTSDDNEKGLLKLVQTLAQGKKVIQGPYPMPFQKQSAPKLHTIEKDPRKTGQTAKSEFLQATDKAARAVSDKIKQVSTSAMDQVTQVQIINSEGLWAQDERTRCRFSVNVTAMNQNEMFTAREAPGAYRGFEFFEGLNYQELGETAAKRALLMLDAGYIVGRKMPVIMGNGFGGVIFHEACGHPLETEAIRRKASPFVGKLGHTIAGSKVTAIDDGTIPNGWGSLYFDDEGTPTQKTILIEKGVLKNFMSDRVGAADLGLKQTGSARRESYKYAPVSRMRNTYIDNGPDTFDGMVASVEDGLYACKMGGGSVNPATGEFNFSVEEGYEIKDGKVGKAVRGATLIGKGHEILPRISMVGNDLALAAGMCGASSGLIPAMVGQPSLKVDNILVGGRS